jgi:hypothetical protein
MKKTNEQKSTDNQIWVSVDSAHFFIIPAGHPFSTGTFELQDTYGDVVYTERETLAQFEVSRAEAEAEFKSQLDQAFGQALKFAVKLWEPSGPAPGFLEDAGRQQERNDFLSGMQALLAGVMAGSEADKQEAILHFSRVQNRPAGGDAPVHDLSELPDIVQSWYDTLSSQESLHELEQILLAQAQQAGQTPEEFGREIDNTIASLEVQFSQMVPTSRQEIDRKQRKKEVRQAARNDIATALRAFGIEPIASVQDDNDE